jgi:hypothetical protein
MKGYIRSADGVNSTGRQDVLSVGSPAPLPCDDGHVTAASSPAASIPEISREQLIRSLRERSVTLVDVLSPESFVAFHIPGAINLPVMDIAREAATVLPDRRQRIVTYCGGPT